MWRKVLFLFHSMDFKILLTMGFNMELVFIRSNFFCLVDGDNISFDIHLNRTYGFEHLSGGSDAVFTFQGVNEIKLL